ncbi:cytochrome P450 [Streptomyces sp. ISL-66]|uniref:cytochrome P450 n=1 Tax=Streptomyces sp. ISL-66 TaxID=2819186 RepID=UPI001BEC5B10|nr:cytochrome P450 [Streptomyces sp. ISL-66]MBT2472179.1 cytochrome P450 [Streptomyces sp. ISL-66]
MQQTASRSPGALPLIGHAGRLAVDPLGFLEKQRAFDPVVALRLAGRECFLMNSAQAAVEVLVAQQDRFDKGGPFMEAARQLVGNGVITCAAEEHAVQRPVMKPAFHRSRVAEYAEVMRECVVEATSSWRAGQVIDVGAVMYRMAALVVSRTLVSAPAGRQAAQAMAEALPQLLSGLLRRMLVPAGWVHRVPVPANRRFDQARARLDDAIGEVIAHYRHHQETDRQDLLSQIMAGDEDSGRRPDDAEVRDQVMSVLAAGVETTASLLAWTFQLLARHPGAEARLWEELDGALDQGPVTFDDLSALAYTKRLLTEVLRLYPPTWLLSRTVVTATEVCGYRLPKGADILISPYALQRNPEVFPDPGRLEPDRWLPERLTPGQRQSFLAFGAGRRRCMGEFFGMTETTLALATIARNWQLRPTAPEPLKPLPRFLLVPAEQPLRLHRRTPQGNHA